MANGGNNCMVLYETITYDITIIRQWAVENFLAILLAAYLIL